MRKLLPLGSSLAALVGGVLLSVPGCGSGDSPAVGTDIAPLTQSTSHAGTIVFGPNVYALDQPTTDAATVSPSSLVFPVAGTSGLAKRQPGDILVSSPSSTNGFMRRIAAISRSGDSWIVDTTQVTLSDVIQDADIHTTITAKAAPLSSPTVGGLLGGKVDVSKGVNWTCGEPGTDCQVTGGIKVTPTLDGSYVDPEVTIDAHVVFSGFVPVYVRFVPHAKLDLLLQLNVLVQDKGAFRVEQQIPGAMWQGVLPLGPIITVTKFRALVGGEVEFYQPQVSFTIGGGFDTELSAGFEIDHGNVKGVTDGGSFTPKLVAHFNGAATDLRLKGYFAQKLDWLLYDAVGPEITIREYLQDDLGGFPSAHYHDYSAGFDVSAKGEVDFFGLVQFGTLSLKLLDVNFEIGKVPVAEPFSYQPCYDAQDGDYCGMEQYAGFLWGTEGHLYTCLGGNIARDVTCAIGCGPATGADAAQGKRVACLPSPSNPCHAAADGNYCGNENLDGFDGGTLGLPASAQITCASGQVSHEISCAGGCGPVSGGARVGCLTPSQGPSAPCGAGDQNGPTNGTCGPDGRVYYCYQGVWHLKDDCVAKSESCFVEPPGVADICVTSSTGGQQTPSAPCGAGDQNGPNNGTCGPDGRVYYCYQGVWYLKDDCLAKGETCVVEPSGVADICQASGRRLQPPTAPCGAGNQAGPDNGTCGPDGRVYYCYQGVWNLKDDCVARGVACVVEPAGVADKCTSGCSADADCGSGESCSGGRCICPGPVCGTSCCSADAWCGSGNRCCTGCGMGCPC
jgi:hypothetical protein